MEKNKMLTQKKKSSLFIVALDPLALPSLLLFAPAPTPTEICSIILYETTIERKGDTPESTKKAKTTGTPMRLLSLLAAVAACQLPVQGFVIPTPSVKHHVIKRTFGNHQQKQNLHKYAKPHAAAGGVVVRMATTNGDNGINDKVR
jgi:hypothetical protein